MNETRRRVLAALADGPVTGPALADELDVSRAAVWKHVEALRDDGFEVSSDDDGYELVAVPEFGGPAIEFGLDAEYAVEYHDALPSTNDRARELADAGERDVLVVADEQTGGRGRLDRAWAAPSGGVWLSMLLGPSLPPTHAPLLTLAAAVATARAAREAGVAAEIKWPNDVLVPREDEAADDDGDGQAAKLAGILTEMEGEADRVSWVVVGVGVNANIHTETLPEGATSLRAERAARDLAPDVDRAAFVQRLVEEFDALQADPDSVLPAWRELSATLGQVVRVETPQGDVVGEAVDVAFPGALVVDTDDGRERVTVGDCDHLRPV
jgi:BirA family biotin operon repressor/biotin-[acetyl-CoA-carboxylase] ligase